MPKQTLTRRNGQLQACEPCRKAKVKCGHEDPACTRCARLEIICFYDPAPMTRSRNPALTKALATPRSLNSTTSQTIRFSQPAQLTDVASPKKSLFKRPATSLGTTEFNATFEENDASFGAEFSYLPDAVEEARPIHQPFAVDSSHVDVPVRPDSLKLGVDILSRFPSSRTCKALLRALGPYDDLWTSPKQIRHCLTTFWDSYGAKMQGAPRQEDFERIATDLCRNNTHDLHITEDCEWFHWFGGPDLRWEMIGILIAFFGLAFYCSQEWDHVFKLPEQQGRNRNSAALFMKNCAEDCLKMCTQTNTNDIVVVLVKNIGRLESVLIGDDNDQQRNKFGSFSSHIFTAGLNRMPASTKSTITPLTEYRSSLGASAYHIDKCESIFSARPPTITRFYCTYKIPLDLSEDELYDGPETLKSALSRLDENGWNTNGSIHASTLLRARCMLTPFWEELLEMTLGIKPQLTCERINELLKKVDEVENSYPRHIQYSNIHEWSRNQGYSGHETYIVTRIHLDVLQCRFLFEKLKLSRGFVSGQRVLHIAQEMMTAVLNVWLNREELQLYHFAFDWIIICYGIPSAGTLCTQLLKSTKIALPGTSPLQFSRSKVIQALTMFNGFLDWTRPTDGNFDLCHKLRRVIDRIVDGVINNTLLQISRPDDSTTQNQACTDDTQPVDAGPYPLDLNLAPDDEDWSWLHTIDWTQSDWLDTNHHFFNDC